MFNRYYLVILFSFACLIPMAISQEVELMGEERQVMERDVLAAYPDEFQEIDITAMTRVDEHYLRMAYETTSGPWEVVIQTNKDNPILVETGQIIPRNEWPDVIIGAMKDNNYTPDQINKVLKVSTPYGEQGYRVDVNSDLNETGKIKRLYFDWMGLYKKPIF